MEVIKRDGSKQVFRISKIELGLEKVLKEAKVDAAKRKVMIKEISSSLLTSLKGKRVIKAVELRSRIIGRLERRSKAAVKVWQRYDKKKK